MLTIKAVFKVVPRSILTVCTNIKKANKPSVSKMTTTRRSVSYISNRIYHSRTLYLSNNEPHSQTLRLLVGIPLYTTSQTRGKHGCTKNTTATAPPTSAHRRLPVYRVFSSRVGTCKGCLGQPVGMVSSVRRSWLLWRPGRQEIFGSWLRYTIVACRPVIRRRRKGMRLYSGRCSAAVRKQQKNFVFCAVH
jgi:hypothetical protein